MELAYINLNHPDCGNFYRKNENIGLKRSSNFNSVQQLNETPRKPPMPVLQREINEHNRQKGSILDHLPTMEASEMNGSAAAANHFGVPPPVPKVGYCII